MFRSIVLIYFDRYRLTHTIKTNFMPLQNVDPEIYSIMTFLEKGMELASPPNKEISFSCYFLLTDQVS